jgi:hypothetical protein
MVVELWQIWDTLANNWVNDEQSTYTYDINSKMIESIKTVWDTILSGWVNTDKVVNNFDTTLLLTSVSMNWNSSSSTWGNSSKRDFIDYDINQNLLELIAYSWNSSINNWEENMRFVNTYNGSGKMIQSLSYTWLGSWDYNSKTTYNYDVNNNQTHN